MSGERARRDVAIALIGLMVGLAVALAIVLVKDGGSGDAASGVASGSGTTSTTVDREGDVIVFLELDITSE